MSLHPTLRVSEIDVWKSIYAAQFDCKATSSMFNRIQTSESLFYLADLILKIRF